MRKEQLIRIKQFNGKAPSCHALHRSSQTRTFSGSVSLGFHGGTWCRSFCRGSLEPAGALTTPGRWKRRQKFAVWGFTLCLKAEATEDAEHLFLLLHSGCLPFRNTAFLPWSGKPPGSTSYIFWVERTGNAAFIWNTPELEQTDLLWNYHLFHCHCQHLNFKFLKFQKWRLQIIGHECLFYLNLPWTNPGICASKSLYCCIV